MLTDQKRRQSFFLEFAVISELLSYRWVGNFVTFKASAGEDVYN